MAPADHWGGMERAELVGGEKILAHPRKRCIGRHCSVHNPSDHSMSGFPQHFRFDRGLMERVCPHGVGHPDPDDLDFKQMFLGLDELDAEGIHGCDGCCR